MDPFKHHRTARPYGTGRCPLVVGAWFVVLIWNCGPVRAQERDLKLIDRCESIVDVENYPALGEVIDSLQKEDHAGAGTRVLSAALRARYLRLNGDAFVPAHLLDSARSDVDSANGAIKMAYWTERSRVRKALGWYDGAMADIKRGSIEARRAHYAKGEAILLTLSAEVKRKQGHMDEALAELITAERIVDSIGYQKGLCNVLINRGNILYSQERYAECLNVYKAVFERALSIGAKGVALYAMHNIGSALKYEQGSEAALAYYSELLKRGPVAEDRRFQMDLMSNIGILNNDLERFATGRVELQHALAVAAELGDSAAIANNMNYLATALWGLGLRPEAITAIEQAGNIARSIGSRDLESDAELKLYKYLKEAGHAAEALGHLERYHALSDSLGQVRNGETIHRLEIQYGTEKKDQKIKLQDLELKETLASKRASDAQRNIILGTLLALVVMGLLGYRNLRQKRVLAEQGRELSEHRVEQVLREQELRVVNAAMEGQERERTRIAKDLHDRVGSLLSAVKLQFSAFEGRVEKAQMTATGQYQKVYDLLDRAVGEVRRISHDMESSNLAAFGLSSALSDLRDAVDVPGKIRVDLNVFGLEERMDKRVEITAYRIVQEAVSNALKHSKAANLSIQATRGAAMLNLIIEDDGVGFDPDKATGSGMGMGNLQTRATELGGHVNVDARPGRGTSISIDLPLEGPSSARGPSQA